MSGSCVDFCDLPKKERSNVGCEFWAVDLPNEYSCISMDGGASCLTYQCAACEQFAVALANTSQFEVTVTVEENTAAAGQPRQLKTVMEKVVGAGALVTLPLPMREVDCTTWKADVTGDLRRTNDSQSCLSSRAYRITSTSPVVAYQFNPIINDFSNGASLLIPTNGLDNDYLVLGWATSNPLSIPLPGVFVEGIPDYMNLTIVGVKDGTTVQVTLAHPTQASADGKVPAANTGETIKIALNAFDVLNINSAQDLQHLSGDLTGSKVVADKPVAVFSGGQRASVPKNLALYDPQPPTPSGSYSTCCTEHFEQQMFPLSALGKTFALTRTPRRSTSWIIEPDFYRVLASEDGTTMTTNLTNYPSFHLDAGGYADFWAVTGFTLHANKPLMVAQYAAAGGFVDQKDVGGDPEFVIFPPVEQYREEYLFLTPSTFDKDYVVISTPKGTSILLDETEVNGEFSSRCVAQTLGAANGIDYLALTCEVADGVHHLKASAPVGLTVYGYYDAGSYGYPGGADFKEINPVH